MFVHIRFHRKETFLAIYGMLCTYNKTRFIFSISLQNMKCIIILFIIAVTYVQANRYCNHSPAEVTIESTYKRTAQYPTQRTGELRCSPTSGSGCQNKFGVDVTVSSAQEYGTIYGGTVGSNILDTIKAEFKFEVTQKYIESQSVTIRKEYICSFGNGYAAWVDIYPRYDYKKGTARSTVTCYEWDEVTGVTHVSQPVEIWIPDGEADFDCRDRRLSG